MEKVHVRLYVIRVYVSLCVCVALPLFILIFKGVNEKSTPSGNGKKTPRSAKGDNNNNNKTPRTRTPSASAGPKSSAKKGGNGSTRNRFQPFYDLEKIEEGLKVKRLLAVVSHQLFFPLFGIFVLCSFVCATSSLTVFITEQNAVQGISPHQPTQPQRSLRDCGWLG